MDQRSEGVPGPWAFAADGPPLLKERRYLRKDAAEQLWKSLQTQGWKPLKEPAWGAAADV